MPLRQSGLFATNMRAILPLLSDEGGFLAPAAMEDLIPSMTRLFDQLGLSSSPASIEAFVAAHKPLTAATVLSEAPFWNSSQAEFLRREVEEDSDWVIVIERLNAALRSKS